MSFQRLGVRIVVSHSAVHQLRLKRFVAHEVRLCL
jgi:hypothetical protein